MPADDAPLRPRRVRRPDAATFDALIAHDDAQPNGGVGAPDAGGAVRGAGAAVRDSDGAMRGAGDDARTAVYELDELERGAVTALYEVDGGAGAGASAGGAGSGGGAGGHAHAGPAAGGAADAGRPGLTPAGLGADARGPDGAAPANPPDAETAVLDALLATDDADVAAPTNEPRVSKRSLWIAGGIAGALVLAIAGGIIALTASSAARENPPVAAADGDAAPGIEIADARVIDAATRSVEVDLKGDPGYTIVVRDPEHPTGGAEGAPDPLGRVWLSIEGTGTLAIHLSDAQLRRDATLTFAYEGHDEPMLSQTLSELGLLEELTRPTPTPSPTETPSPTPTPTEEPQPAPWQPQPAPQPEQPQPEKPQPSEEPSQPPAEEPTQEPEPAPSLPSVIPDPGETVPAPGPGSGDGAGEADPDQTPAE